MEPLPCILQSHPRCLISWRTFKTLSILRWFRLMLDILLKGVQWVWLHALEPLSEWVPQKLAMLSLHHRMMMTVSIRKSYTSILKRLGINRSKIKRIWLRQWNQSMGNSRMPKTYSMLVLKSQNQTGSLSLLIKIHTKKYFKNLRMKRKLLRIQESPVTKMIRDLLLSQYL